MNVFLRLLKVLGIGFLFVLNENLDWLYREFKLPVHLTSGIVGFLLFFLMSELIRDILAFLYKRRKNLANLENDNVMVGLNNIYVLILTGGALYFILHLLKLKPSQFFTGVSLISASLAIIMKDYISNIFSGMILAFSDKLKIGDYVQIGNVKGEIMDFSLTMVTLRNDDDEIVYVPASHIYNHELINFSALDHDHITVDFELNNKMKLSFEELNSNINLALTKYKTEITGEGQGTLFIYKSNQESTSFKYKYALKSKDIVLNREIKSAILRAVYDHTKMNTL